MVPQHKFRSICLLVEEYKKTINQHSNEKKTYLSVDFYLLLHIIKVERKVETNVNSI